MAIYLLENNAKMGKTHRGGSRMLVSAADATDAKLIAAAHQGGDSAWSDATTTALADVTVNTAGALVGWTFEIDVTGAGTAGALGSVSHTGVTTTSDVLDEIGTALATALNTLANIANAAYVTATQTLTVASGGGGDDLGDKTVTVRVYAPAVTGTDGQRINQRVDLSSIFVSSITDGGDATDALTVVFNADTTVLATVLSVLP